MTLVFGRGLLVHLPFILLIASFGAAQESCPLPPAVQTVSQGDNIFSDQQEIDLGDAMAESLAQRVRIIHDDHLNEYLNALGTVSYTHLTLPTNREV